MAKNDRSKIILARLYVGASVLVIVFAVNVAKFGNDRPADNLFPPVVQTVKVLVANSNIEPNERLREKLVFQDWPINRISKGRVQRIDDVSGLVAARFIYRGELIVTTMLTAPKRDIKK